MRLGVLGLAAVALAAGGVGCGGDATDEPLEALARYLPAGEPGVIFFADLDQAREQLGLPADADALSVEILAADDYDPDSPQASLLAATMGGIPALPIHPRTFEPKAVAAALDGTAISAAATGGGRDGSLTVIRTTQPFDELATALVQQGYERDGDVLAKPGTAISEIADAGDGVFVLSDRKAKVSAAAAVAEPAGGPAAVLALLEPADEPIVEAGAGLPDDCVTGYGGWSDASGSSGAFRVATADEAQLERIQPEGFDKYTDAELGEPSVDGDTFEVPFSGGGEDGARPIRDLVQGSLGVGMYDCT